MPKRPGSLQWAYSNKYCLIQLSFHVLLEWWMHTKTEVHVHLHARSTCKLIGQLSVSSHQPEIETRQELLILRENRICKFMWRTMGEIEDIVHTQARSWKTLRTHHVWAAQGNPNKIGAFVIASFHHTNWDWTPCPPITTHIIHRIVHFMMVKPSQ